MTPTESSKLIQGGISLAGQASKGNKDVATVAGGAASGAALGSLIPVPLVGTAIGAVVGAIAGMIKVSFTTSHAMKIENIDGLRYRKIYPKDNSSLALYVLDEGGDKLNTLQANKARIDSAMALSKASSDARKLLTIESPDYVKKALTAKGINPALVNRFILETPDGMLYGIRGNQLYSSVVPTQQEVNEVQKVELAADKELLKSGSTDVVNKDVISMAGFSFNKNWVVTAIVVIIVLSMGYTLYKNR